MKHKRKIWLSIGLAAIVVATAPPRHLFAGTPAVPLIDGTADALYGAALFTQNTDTQFGNATTGDPINAGGGSEIDQVFATIAEGRLYVLVAGNLETNFNKLEIFLDTAPGGVNVVDGETNDQNGNFVSLNLPGGVDPFCCDGFPPPNGNNANNIGALQRMDGLTFDTGFEADHYLTFTHGIEDNKLDSSISFYAFTAHYADLTDGVNGRTGSLGMQLAHRGLPNVLRGTTGDTDVDGTVDGGEFLTWQRGVGQFDGTTTFATRTDGDSSSDQIVDGVDLDIWEATFGFDVANSTFDADLFAPRNGNVDNSDVLLGPALPSLNQGELIDKTYVLGPGGATDNSGTGRLTEELEFALPVDPADAGNAFSHRDMENIVDLRMAVDNSNVEGVSGDAPYTTETEGNPQDVITGVEFSIPLSEIGFTTGDIKIMAFINGGGHDYASNQFIGTGILDGNLGSDGFGAGLGHLEGVNMNDFAGNQFVTVPGPIGVAAVPEPATAALVLIAAFACAPRRRRR